MDRALALFPKPKIPRSPWLRSIEAVVVVVVVEENDSNVVTKSPVLGVCLSRHSRSFVIIRLVRLVLFLKFIVLQL